MAENKKALENLDLFVSKFLCGPGKFIGGFDTPSIADYVCAVKLHCVNHPAIKAGVGFELPARVKAYVSDFLGACPSTAFLEGHDAFLKTKMQTKVVVRGMAISHNVIPAVLLARDTGCGDFEARALPPFEALVRCDPMARPSRPSRPLRPSRPSRLLHVG